MKVNKVKSVYSGGGGRGGPKRFSKCQLCVKITESFGKLEDNFRFNTFRVEVLKIDEQNPSSERQSAGRRDTAKNICRCTLSICEQKKTI